MKAMLHSVGRAEARRRPGILWREKKEKPCQEVDVMSPGNDYVGWRASLTTPEGR